MSPSKIPPPAWKVIDMACYPNVSPHQIPRDGSIAVTVTPEIEPFALVAFVSAIETWQGVLRLKSVTRAGYEDPYDPTTMLLTSCPEARDPNDNALARASNKGVFVVHPDLVMGLTFERRILLFAHELGHVIGMPDSTDPFTVMNFGAGVSPYPRDVCEAKRLLGQPLCEGL